MSIKIYDAYRTSDPLSKIRDAFFALREPRLKTWEDRMQIIFQTQAEKDSENKPLEQRIDAATELAACFSHSVQTGSSAIASPEISAVLFPCHDGRTYTTDNVLLIYDYSNDRKETLKALRRKLKFTDYGYWDNVDPPDDISEKDWKLRKKAWGKMLLDGDGVPSKQGFTLEVIDKKDVHLGVWDAHIRMRNAKYPNESPWEKGWRSYFIASDLHELKSGVDVKDKLVEILVKGGGGPPGTYTGTEAEFRLNAFNEKPPEPSAI